MADEERSMQPEAAEPKASTSSRWGLVWMISILMVAAVLSALTAMRFAIRGREVIVPPLVGKTQAEAQKELEDRGLLLKVSSKRFSADIAEGRVVDQIPPSGTHL